MKDTILQTCLQSRYTYEILGDLKVTIHIENNPFQMPASSLFSMAARKNKKRGFLFVSKILGKHIPVNPALSMLGGAALAARFLSVIYEQEVDLLPSIIRSLTGEESCGSVIQSLQAAPFSLPEKALFIGFAETATALGHSMFDCFGENAAFMHTTREVIPDLQPIIKFEEEHSHAVSHRCYPLNPVLLAEPVPIVLVDDELTTGNTALNIISDIQCQFPRKEYIVASLLDWRSEENRSRFKQVEEKLGVRIRTVSLLEGQIEVEGSPIIEENYTSTEETGEITSNINRIVLDQTWWKLADYSSIDSKNITNKTPYLAETGRFGIDSSERTRIQQITARIGRHLQQLRGGNKTLCLGTGEFMYVPMLIAFYMGEGVFYQSTTRSPIHPSEKEGYGIQNAFSYPSPDDPNIHNYFYNIPYGYYDDLFIFLERDIPDERLGGLRENLERLGIRNIHFVVCAVKQSG